MVEGINFPVAIKDKPSQSIIKLPWKASNLEIDLNVGNFFSGPVADYSIECPFCKDSKIKLSTSLNLDREIKEITSAVDYAWLDPMVVILSNNMLYIMNETYDIVG